MGRAQRYLYRRNCRLRNEQQDDQESGEPVSAQGSGRQTAICWTFHHSDRGSQYCSKESRKLLQRFKMQSSMSRRSDCYDNAPMESFWGTLKTELTFPGDTRPGRRRCKIFRSTLRSFIIAKENRKNSVIFHRLPMSVGFINCKKQRRIFVSTIDDPPHTNVLAANIEALTI